MHAALGAGLDGGAATDVAVVVALVGTVEGAVLGGATPAEHAAVASRRTAIGRLARVMLATLPAVGSATAKVDGESRVAASGGGPSPG